MPWRTTRGRPIGYREDDSPANGKRRDVSSTGLSQHPRGSGRFDPSSGIRGAHCGGATSTARVKFHVEQFPHAKAVASRGEKDPCDTHAKLPGSFLGDSQTLSRYAVDLHLVLSCEVFCQRIHLPFYFLLKKCLTGRRIDFCQHRSEEHTSELQSPCNLVC